MYFLGKKGVASPWRCHAPLLLENYYPLPGLKNGVLWVFVPFVVFEQIELKVESLKFSQFYKVKSRKFTNSNFKLNFLKNYKWYKDPKYLIFSYGCGQENSRKIGAWKCKGIATPFFPKKEHILQTIQIKRWWIFQLINLFG